MFESSWTYAKLNPMEESMERQRELNDENILEI